jgi:hypothetical protein
MPGRPAQASLSARREVHLTLTRKDASATVVAALVVLVYVANSQDWWYLGSTRWAILTTALVGVNGCAFGSKMQGRPTLPTALLGLLGAASLVIAVVGVIAASHALLLALTIVLLALWFGATLRHAAGSAPRAVPS